MFVCGGVWKGKGVLVGGSGILFGTNYLSLYIYIIYIQIGIGSGIRPGIGCIN